MATVFRIKLDGAQVVPGVDTPYTGVGIAIFDAKRGTLSYSINFKGLDFGSYIGQPSTPASADDVSGLHFHNAARGANGALILDWTENKDFRVEAPGNRAWTVLGEWEKADAGNSIGQYAPMMKNAVAGEDIPIYADIHTVGNPDGEIRGQFVTLSTERAEVVRGTKADDVLPGLGGGDRIEGRRGSDLIGGDKGNDILAGGQGGDTFLFSTRLDAEKNVDRILDFRGKDVIWLDSSVFKKLPLKELHAKNFYEGDGAHDADDRIIVDGRTLIYDRNGDKRGGDTAFAKVDKGADFGPEDFFVF